jgi:hypothetical protein
MVRDLFLDLCAAIGLGWKFLLRCPGLAKLFPPKPPTSVSYPLIRSLRWSLTSVVQSGNLDPTDPIQAMIATDRQRFANGELLVSLAEIAARDVSIVARIAEAGAIKAQHMVVLIHGDNAQEKRKSQDTVASRGRVLVPYCSAIWPKQAMKNDNLAPSLKPGKKGLELPELATRGNRIARTR